MRRNDAEHSAARRRPKWRALMPALPIAADGERDAATRREREPMQAPRRHRLEPLAKRRENLRAAR